MLVHAPARATAGVFDILAPDTDWTLFHPTPRAKMRGVAAPTTPYTVDAGHVQLDVEPFDAAWERGGTGEPEVDILGFTARLGLTRRTDLQLSWVPYRKAMVRDGADTMSLGRGIGDTTVRLGLNLWGNDGGVSAAGLVPYVRIPTATGGVGTGALEGGLAVPIGLRLPARVDALVVGVVEFADDVEGRRGVHPRMAVTAGLGRAVAGPVAARLEWTTTADAEGAVLTYDHELEGRASVDLGADARIDVGAAVGMLHDPTISPFLRVSYRR
jgi:hypothetical protein